MKVISNKRIDLSISFYSIVEGSEYISHVIIKRMNVGYRFNLINIINTE
jgi:hypothetical protein